MIRKSRHGDDCRPGFSLVEVLLVIAIVGVLAGLVLPLLSGARDASRRVRSQSNLQSLGVVISLYSSDHASRFPALYPDTSYPRQRDLSFRDNWWSVAWNWAGIVYGYLPIDSNIGTYISPGSIRLTDISRNRWPTSYWYSTSFVARPSLWSGSAEASYSALVAQRHEDVLFPTQKILLWDSEYGTNRGELRREGPDLAENVPSLFADGSGKSVVPASASVAVPNPFRYIGFRLRLQNTQDGVRGLDYRP